MDAKVNHEKILSYLDEHGVSDKDAVTLKSSKKYNKKNCLEKTRKGQLRKVIDMHGMISEDAEICLARAIEDCLKNGIKELLVIHGWGSHSGGSEGGVLKKMVREALEYRYKLSLRGYKNALPRDGGEGATLITLK